MLNDKIFILKDTFVYFTQKAHSRQKCVNFHIKKAHLRQKCVNFHIEIYFKTGFNLLYLGLQDCTNLQSWCDVFVGLTILYHLVSLSLFYDKLFKRYELGKVKYYEILKNISAMLKTHAGG